MPGIIALSSQLELGSAAWVQKASMSTAPYAFGVAALGNFVVVAGGILGTTPVATAEVYNIAHNNWTTVGSLAHTRSWFNLVVVGTDVFALGGRPYRGSLAEAIERLSLASLLESGAEVDQTLQWNDTSWRLQPSLLGFASLVNGLDILIVGGFDENDNERYPPKVGYEPPPRTSSRH